MNIANIKEMNYFIIEFFIEGKLSQKIAKKTINFKKSEPIIITIIISSIIVCLMCPIMSFIANILFNYNGIENIIANWLQTWVKNFPMALCFQLFYAGPFVRFIFKKIFHKQLAK